MTDYVCKPAVTDTEAADVPASGPWGLMSISAVIVAVMCAVNAVWAWQAGFIVLHWLKPVSEIAGIWVVFTAYLHFRPNPRLSEMLNYVVLWLLFSTAAAVSTYLAATLALPLQDTFYAAVDHALRFNLAGFTRVLLAYPLVFAFLKVDYHSLVLQISATVLWLAHTRTKGRNAEFLCCAIISLLITCLLAALLPAVGSPMAENPSLRSTPDWVPEILALRSGLIVTRAMEDLQGIVCFPSYHTVLAMLITRAHRGLASFWPVAIVNGLMLLAILPVGNHYVADLLGGGGVAILSILVVRRIAATGERSGLQPVRTDELEHGLV